ncbi:hypothetical protein [Actinomadura fibrosa]|uniref:M23 family metallopeptidase n=2 Tax=Actinomadura fibrosa TaxID=111802 RepID=A0ABW2XM88_9ACTN
MRETREERVFEPVAQRLKELEDARVLELLNSRVQAPTEERDARVQPAGDARVQGLRVPERREPERAAASRQPERPAARKRPPGRQRTPERAPGPRARPRGLRGPADRLSIGAIVLSTVVGLSLLGIVERTLLEGGPIGASGPVGSTRPTGDRKAPALPAASSAPRQQPVGGGGGTAAPAAPDTQGLTAQVRKLTLAQRGAAARQAYGAAATGAPIVNTARTSADRTWVFGMTAIPVPAGSPASPEIAFFAARWRRDRWQIGLSGGAAFNGLLGAMPASVMSAGEAAALRKYASVTAQQATALIDGTRAGDGLVLPWKVGDAWSMNTADGASVRPLGSLAFSGGDGRVLAAGGGRLYRFCKDSAGRALVMVVHPSGVASTYYRMRSVTQLRDGSVVKRGDPLGRTGGDRPCGGAASPRADVEFDLRRGAESVPLDGAVLGGWTFRERAKPLLGFAERGALQVLPGGLLANLGPVPAAEAPPSSPAPADPAGEGADPGGAPAPSATENGA